MKTPSNMRQPASSTPIYNNTFSHRRSSPLNALIRQNDGVDGFPPIPPLLESTPEHTLTYQERARNTADILGYALEISMHLKASIEEKTPTKSTQ